MYHYQWTSMGHVKCNWFVSPHQAKTDDAHGNIEAANKKGYFALGLNIAAFVVYLIVVAIIVGVGVSKASTSTVYYGYYYYYGWGALLWTACNAWCIRLLAHIVFRDLYVVFVYIETGILIFVSPYTTWLLSWLPLLCDHSWIWTAKFLQVTSTCFSLFHSSIHVYALF